MRDIARPDDFHADAHRRIFGHFLAMRNGGNGAIDSTLLLYPLRRAATSRPWAGRTVALPRTLLETIHQTPIRSNASTTPGSSRRTPSGRRVIHAATEILRDAYNGVAPAVLRQRIDALWSGSTRQRGRLSAHDAGGTYGP